MKFTAFLPLKLNSERVKDKNFIEINSKPLFYYVLKTLSDTELVDQIVIDIDKEKIKDYISEYFDDIEFTIRDDKLLNPSESVNNIIKSNLDKFNNDYIIQTHVTNPLLTRNTLHRALNTYLKNEVELFSVNKYQSRFYNHENNPVNHDMNELIPTQLLKPVYEENSNFYIFSKMQFEKNNYKRIGKKSIPHETPIIESVDIDDYEDLELVEKLI